MAWETQPRELIRALERGDSVGSFLCSFQVPGAMVGSEDPLEIWPQLRGGVVSLTRQSSP